jgi:hypothetical protein
MLNIFSVPAMAPEGELEIVVDSMSKEVLPGEDAIFYWTAYNNDTYTSYDLSASSPGTEFSESSFTLKPGESKLVIQTASTSVNDTNDTRYFYKVRWDGTWHQGPVSGSITPMEGMMNVYVINNSDLDKDNGDNGNNGEEDDNGNDSTPGFESLFLIVAILVASSLVGKKRKKSHS